MNSEERDYLNNNKPRPYVYILAQPYSGSELLTELLSVFGSNVSTCDKMDLFKGIININENFKSCKLHTERYPKWEEIDSNSTRYCLRSILYKGNDSGVGVTTSIGWCNDMVDPFVETLRKIHENDRTPVKIVYLTRNIEDVISKFASDNCCDLVGEQSSMFRDKIIKQHSQFKLSMELGEMWLSYEGFMSDIKGTLLKLRPRNYPDDATIKRIVG